MPKRSSFTVAEKWAVGTVADGVTGTATTFVANMFDTEGDISESLQRTGDSMAMIWGNAAITSAVSVAAEAAVTPKCFVAGTAVVTSVGLVAIEHIKPGDVVLAENEETGEIAYKEVVRTFTNTTEELTHVTITTEDGQIETIDATPQHPFYVEGKGWVEASALHAGMVVWLADGTKAVVTDVVTEGLEEPVTVYNFEVADFHTYFVGDSGVLVHNKCDGEYHHIASDKSIASGYTEQYQKVFDQAGMSLQDDANIIYLEGHHGAHTKVYKEYVLNYITDAVGDKTGEEAKQALTGALNRIAEQLRQNPRMPYRGGM